MKRMLLLVSAVTTPLLVGGCSGADTPAAKATTGKPNVEGSASPSAFAGRQLATNDLVVTVPAGWKKVDPTTDSSDVVAQAYGTKEGPAADLSKELLKMLKGKGAVWAIDPTSASGAFATHLTGACDSGGMMGSSLEALRRTAQALHKGAQIADITVSGKPALRIAYTETATLTGRTSETIEVRVPVSDDKYCYVNLNAKPGRLAGVADPIIKSFALR
ncbi:hypothetical protein [Actinomadura sp. HBU206391]|uniref:hypothetical protein n=1 Tax=Actinomadura sp. HBU206391 TaxID=2731692 RepID=UPI0016509177|nr:hypothetical protein [Actinomadura sp. HBU206391]MBC6458366.1 hypothetical protein [Actinomadura sp. HBU206391]